MFYDKEKNQIVFEDNSDAINHLNHYLNKIGFNITDDEYNWIIDRSVNYCGHTASHTEGIEDFEDYFEIMLQNCDSYIY